MPSRQYSGPYELKRKNSRSVLSWFCWGFLGFLLAALFVLLAWTLILKFQQPEFALPPAADEDADFLPFPAPPASNFTVSLEIPFENLRSAIQSSATDAQSNVGIGGYKVSWEIAGTSTSVFRKAADLLIEGRIGGELRINQGAPWMLKILGTTFQLDIGYSIRTGLSLREDWGLQTDPAVKTQVYKALKPASFSFLRTNIKDDISPYVNQVIRERVNSFQRKLGANGIVEKAARKAWSSLCTSIPLSPEQDAWLEFRPSRLRAAPIEIEADAIGLQVSFDVDTRIVTHFTQPSCPFPERLVIEDEKPGLVHLSMPVFIDYKVLQSIANKALSETFMSYHELLVARDRNISRGSWTDEEEERLKIYAPRIGPFWFSEVQRLEKRGQALLVSAALLPALNYDKLVSFAEAVQPVLGTDATKGMIFYTANILAEVRQDPGTQRISLSNIRLDTEAQNFVFAALLELVEPWMLRELEDWDSYDLTALQGQVEWKLHQVLNPRGIDAKLHEFSVTRLELGPKSLRALVAATGSVDVTVQQSALTAFD